MALSGSANKRLVAALNDQGVAALGLSGEDAGLLTATLLDADRYGYVGAPTSVNVTLLRHLLAGDVLPVISPVSRHAAATGDGPATLNVNGDDAAAAIAVALEADELLLVSDVAGVLVDGVAVEELEADDARQLIADGTATGGMGAKLQAALAALASGVARVRISDITAIESLDRGTILTRVESVCA
jgi:acetylglutamate kinase